MNMASQIYNQPLISVEEQIQLLKSEGLSFIDEGRAHSTTFTKRFKALLNKYQQIDITAMGFPSDWKNIPLWNQ